MQCALSELKGFDVHVTLSLNTHPHLGGGASPSDQVLAGQPQALARTPASCARRRRRSPEPCQAAPGPLPFRLHSTCQVGLGSRAVKERCLQSFVCTRRGLGRPPGEQPVGPVVHGAAAPSPAGLPGRCFWVGPSCGLRPQWPSSSGPWLWSHRGSACFLPLGLSEAKSTAACDCQPRPPLKACPVTSRSGHQRPAASSWDTQSPAVLL